METDKSYLSVERKIKAEDYEWSSEILCKQKMEIMGIYEEIINEQEQQS